MVRVLGDVHWGAANIPGRVHRALVVATGGSMMEFGRGNASAKAYKSVHHIFINNCRWFSTFLYNKC